jgi:hypothetical protein
LNLLCDAVLVMSGDQLAAVALAFRRRAASIMPARRL